MKLEEELNKFINDPYNPELNFNLGVVYRELGQTTSAYSYFLRTSEYSTDIDLIYESLLLCGLCLNKQEDHKKSEKGMYLHAISVDPDRPEGYYFLSRFHENQADWIDSYTTSIIGLKNLKTKYTRSNIGYSGHYSLIFQKAVSSWWIGRHEESKILFNQLFNEYEDEMELNFKVSVHNNLTFLNKGEYPKLPYSRLLYDKLKFNFRGSKLIKQNFSQSYQDMFILTMLDGKTNGTYVEIGSSDPFSGNNTALLETQYRWNGISFDILENEVNKFKEVRKNPVFLEDATKVDYVKYFKEHDFKGEIDYLQLDCDPPEVTYEILRKIPFDKYKFRVITYEHDHYVDKSNRYRDESRVFLKSKGYELVASNIAPNDTDNYEDWWVYPGLVNQIALLILKNDDETVKNAEKYMLK